MPKQNHNKNKTHMKNANEKCKFLVNIMPLTLLEYQREKVLNFKCPLLIFDLKLCGSN